MMVDSGTTFTHMPTNYLNKILEALNKYCKVHSTKCGRLDNPSFEEDSCLELKQPDEHYANVDALLNSFPNIDIHIRGGS